MSPQILIELPNNRDELDIEGQAAHGEMISSRQGYWDAELLRLRGELLAASGAPAGEVRALFQQAIDVATRQGAIALVRRAQRSLEQLLSHEEN